MSEMKLWFGEMEEVAARRAREGGSYLEFLRVPAMSVGLYELKAGGQDPQTPHKQDEAYLVISGRARIRVAAEERNVARGSFIFVAAGVEHRFFDIEADLSVLVFFAPGRIRLTARRRVPGTHGWAGTVTIMRVLAPREAPSVGSPIIT